MGIDVHAVENSSAMKRTRREDGPTPRGGAYSVTTWDDETGDAEIVEFTPGGAILSRHEWRLWEDASPRSDGVVGEMVTFDADGAELSRKPIRSDVPRIS
jgi:hypothetical protein